MGLLPRTLQVAERIGTAVLQTQALPAHLHAVRLARLRDVSGLPELRVWKAPATRDFSLSNSGRRVKRFRVSGLSVRRIDGCRRPAWRYVDRVHIALVRFEALRLPPGFPDPVRRLFALALSSVCPASPATPTYALTQAKAEPRNLSFFISSFVPATLSS